MILTVACNPDANCGEVNDKVFVDNQYILVIRFDKGSTSNQNEYSGELVGDIEVNEETFSSYEKGKNYCIAELMLHYLPGFGILSFSDILTTCWQLIVHFFYCGVMFGVMPNSSNLLFD